MNLWKPIILLVTLLTLGGCVEAGMQAYNTAKYAVAEATDLVHEVDGYREDIREKCWELLEDEVEELEDEGDRRSARALLRLNYPPLVTQTILGGLADDPSKILAELFGCKSLPEDPGAPTDESVTP